MSPIDLAMQDVTSSLRLKSSKCRTSPLADTYVSEPCIDSRRAWSGAVKPTKLFSLKISLGCPTGLKRSPAFREERRGGTLRRGRLELARSLLSVRAPKIQRYPSAALVELLA